MSRAAHAGWAAFCWIALIVNAATFRMFPDVICLPILGGCAAYHTVAAWRNTP